MAGVKHETVGESMRSRLERIHRVRIGLIGNDVYVYGSCKEKTDSIRAFSKELKAEMHAEQLIARAQTSARLATRRVL